jgi:hypothetical protein
MSGDGRDSLHYQISSSDDLSKQTTFRRRRCPSRCIVLIIAIDRMPFLTAGPPPQPPSGSTVVGQSVPPGSNQARLAMRSTNGGDAIARWFGPDVYGDRRLPNMPGQRVMTVDEIECSALPSTN